MQFPSECCEKNQSLAEYPEHEQHNIQLQDAIDPLDNREQRVHY